MVAFNAWSVKKRCHAIKKKSRLLLGLLGGGVVVLLSGADIPTVEAVRRSRARVVIAENSRATVAFEPVPKIVQSMVDHGILKLTGKPDLKLAWRTFVTNQDVVGIKVYSGPGANSGTRLAVVGAVIEGIC